METWMVVMSAGGINSEVCSKIECSGGARQPSAQSPLASLSTACRDLLQMAPCSNWELQLVPEDEWHLSLGRLAHLDTTQAFSSSSVRCEQTRHRAGTLGSHVARTNTACHSSKPETRTHTHTQTHEGGRTPPESVQCSPEMRAAPLQAA